MATYIEGPAGITEKIFMWMAIAAVLLLGVVLMQPVWNAKHLIQQQTDDCKKVGGVQIIDHGMFGDTYSCQPRLDRGVKP